MKRDIITINQDLCNGCGQCVPGCPEGALQIIDGKARLISDLFCDGLGACIGECPEKAITIEKREAEPYDEARVMANIVKQGEATILAHLIHLRDHNETGFLNAALKYLQENNFTVPPDFTASRGADTASGAACGCPGSAEQVIRHGHGHSSGPAVLMESELSQWPVQLQLINPQAPFFRDADILIAADCVPFSYANFHQKFLKGKKLIIFCPKLDTTIESYIQKLKELFAAQNIRSVTILHMEVPCCFGVGKIVQAALDRAGMKIPVEDITISIDGNIKK